MKPGPDLERTMWRSSLLVTLVAAALMLGGFIFAALSPQHLFSSSQGLQGVNLSGRPQRLMMAGMILLSLLPGIRVLIALSHYALARRIIEALIAAIVLLELVLSMFFKS